MNEKYIELRTRNSFGDIISTYFNFLKHNFKNFTAIYLKYNAVSIVLCLLSAYLLVTGFIGLASRDFRFGMGGPIDNDSYLIWGAVILFLTVFATTLINYSYSSAYVSGYVKNAGEVESRDIYSKIRRNLITIVIFVLFGIALYIGFIIISLLFSLIPVLGMFVQYGMSFLISAIFGLTFMSIIFRNNGLGESISEAWDLIAASFWKVILYGLVIGILNLMITTLIISIPTFVLSIYIYFSIETEIQILSSVFASVLFTIRLAIFILAIIYTQALSQVAYGILYLNLYEEKNNVFLRKRIEEIGSHA